MLSVWPKGESELSASWLMTGNSDGETYHTNLQQKVKMLTSDKTIFNFSGLINSEQSVSQELYPFFGHPCRLQTPNKKSMDIPSDWQQLSILISRLEAASILDQYFNSWVTYTFSCLLLSLHVWKHFMVITAQFDHTRKNLGLFQTLTDTQNILYSLFTCFVESKLKLNWAFCVL